MAANKKNKYTNVELDWAEKQLRSWQAYVDNNPYELMEDRIKLKETKNGGAIPVTCATIEQQQKNIRETVKEYLLLIDVVDDLRAKEEVRSNNTYGNIQESVRMKNTQEKRDE